MLILLRRNLTLLVVFALASRHLGWEDTGRNGVNPNLDTMI